MHNEKRITRPDTNPPVELREHSVNKPTNQINEPSDGTVLLRTTMVEKEREREKKR